MNPSRDACFSGPLPLAAAALTALESGASAQQPVVGRYSNNAIADFPNQASPTNEQGNAGTILEIKIKRTMLSGPSVITEDATVIDNDKNGKPVILRKGTNQWVCFPGDENEVGSPPMCADRMAMRWFADVAMGRSRPTNTEPGVAYMLCGATQHSNTGALDTTSPGIPIGPHFMILWPFDAKKCGLPSIVRDAGAWVMFNETPYAYLHVCGSPWVGNEYVQGETSPCLDYALFKTSV